MQFALYIIMFGNIANKLLITTRPTKNKTTQDVAVIIIVLLNLLVMKNENSANRRAVCVFNIPEINQISRTYVDVYDK